MRGRWTLAIWLGIFAVLVANAAPNFDTTVDDAWISARYARHLVQGHGLVYNVGERPIEGFSNPAWTVWLAVGLALGVPLWAWMTTTGLAFAAGSAVVARAWARDLAGAEHPVLWTVPLAIALCPQLAVACTNGLETGQWLFCIVLAGWLVHRAEGPWAGVLAGVVAGGLAAVRPEGLAVGGLFVVSHHWTHRADLRQPQTWAVAAAASTAVVTLLGWRLWTYGAWLPNTVDAKANLDLARMVEANGRYLGFDGALWPAVAVVLVLAPCLPPLRAARLVPALAGLVCWAAAVQVLLWMPGARLMLPGFVLAAVGAGAAAAARPTRARLALGVAPAVLAVVTLLTPVHGFVRGYDRRNTVVPHNPARRAAEHIEAHATAGARLAVRDAGVIAYHVGTGVRVDETHPRALTQPHPEGANTDVKGFLTNGGPELVVTTVQRLEHERPAYSGDRQVLATRGAAYRWLGRVEQHHHRFYDLWIRHDVTLPALPEAWLAPYIGPAPR